MHVLDKEVIVPYVPFSQVQEALFIVQIHMEQHEDVIIMVKKLLSIEKDIAKLHTSILQGH